MTKTDKAALKLAMEHARREPGRGEQLDDKLKDEPWEAVAQFAAYCAQSRSLRLKPWESPPCHADEGGDDHDAELLRKMLAAGVSRWHPSPLDALEEASH